MNGVITNGLSIIIGTALGLLLRKQLKTEIKNLMMSALAFCVIIIGIKDAFDMNNPILILISVIAGGAIGHMMGIEKRLNGFAGIIEAKYSKEGDTSSVGQGFIMSTIIFCVGAMSIMGSIKAGISGDHSLLYVKTMLDGVSSMIFASTMGFGVGLSVVPVVIYQGLIYIFASYLQPIMTPEIVTELSAVGGIIVMMIGFNILELKKMPIADFLPAIVIPVIYGLIF
ncbi:MAG: DUF554 domain-containing protein [Tissierellia bacterium]|nr:DUF554 domain-containing protein [Tissierellia bacterium]